MRTIFTIFALALEKRYKAVTDIVTDIKQPKVISLTIKFSNLLMRILDSTLTCLSRAVEKQSHQLLLSGIKDLNNNCVIEEYAVDI